MKKILISWKWPAVEQSGASEIWDSGRKRVYVQLLELSFMPKYGNFENRIASRKLLPVERK